MNAERTSSGRVTAQRRIADILELSGLNAEDSMAEARNILAIALEVELDNARLDDDGGPA